MGSAASMPLARAAPYEKGLTHAQRVTRLYRNTLRNTRDWLIDYDAYVMEARKIQREFKSRKHLTREEGEIHLERGLADLFKYRHPEPYIPNYMEGGSKYQRNVPPPPELAERCMPPPEQCIK